MATTWRKRIIKLKTQIFILKIKALVGQKVDKQIEIKKKNLQYAKKQQNREKILKRNSNQNNNTNE